MKYKIKVNGHYIKEVEYSYLIECSEEEATIFTQEQVDYINHIYSHIELIRLWIN